MRTLSPSSIAIAFACLAACAVPANDTARSDDAPLTLPIGVVGGVVSVNIGPSLSDRAYYFEGLGSRCFDFGGQAYWALGGPVYLYGCNGSIAQQVRVRELDGSHDVELRVQSLYCLGVRGGQVAIGQPLELQTCNGSPAQRFALDGDSVLMGYQASGPVARDVVIEPANDATPNRTPLVVGQRDTSDAEYFRVQTVDGSNLPPTSGWTKVASDAALRSALGIGWGAVIEIDPTQPLVLSSSIATPSGVTLRGYRKHKNPGPTVTFNGSDDAAIVVNADAVRITGMRLVGNANVGAGAIAITSDRRQRVIVDHDEITGWKGPAIGIAGADAPCNLYDSLPCDPDAPPEGVCPTAPYSGPLAYPRPTDVRILRTFVHDNSSYGIVTGNGAMILAQGNVEYLNQHSLASDPWRLSGYEAYDNFLLGPAIDSPHSSNQDFDAHGSLDPGHWHDGIAGDYFDVGWNTFLQRSHYDFNLRGTPCRFAAFHDNVSTQSSGDALTSLATKPMSVYSDSFSAADPTSDLAVADFDGDHVDDVFVGTGATWWFSSGGQTEWRLLNRMPEHASALRFGDFDGDGRADALAIHGANVDVSWGGVSPWQTIDVVAWAITDLAVGDFDGDRVSDLFLATGSEWFYAPGGRSWTVFTSSSYRTSALRFGDFTGDGRTDVLGVVAGQWMIVRGGGTSWEPLRSALTSDVSGLVVADFDGDAIADVARTVPGGFFSSPEWQISSGGRGAFVNARSDGQNLASALVGRFDGDAKADVLEWFGNRFDISSAARGSLGAWSTQAMR